ncbi:MAG: NAD-binding protein, partial [Chloroflexi bacterium]|nr:NAD-binding protein [Chloroflexota bacterium]
MGKLLFRSQKITLYLVFLVSLVAVAAVACGSDDDEVAPTAAAQPTAQPTAAQAAATNTPAPVASTGGPSGSIVAALEDVGVPIGTPGLCVPGCANEKYFFSAFDTLVHWTADDKVAGGVAESWVLAPDLSKFTWNIRKGIQFHKGWGELTAKDVAFSTNAVNSNTNPDSVHDVAGDMSCCYGPTTVIDTYTAETEIITFDSRAPGWLFSNLRDAYGISSSDVFDEFGSEGMRDVFVGSGPYQILEWLDGDRLILEAVEHYRKTPNVLSVRILEVPEEASRIAMFKSGEADITHVSLPNVSVLEAEGGIKRLLETVITHVAFAPNFLEKTNPKTGEPLDNPGFDGSLPWVSDPFAEGCNWDILLVKVPDEADLCDELNNPRKVRLALAMVINQDALIEGLDYAYPKSVKIGGLASGAGGPGDNALFINGRVLRAGAVGGHLAEVLAGTGHNITVIEKNAATLQALENELDIGSLRASCTHASALFEAGVADCDMFIAATDNDEVNLLSAAVATAMGAARCVARIHHRAYFDSGVFSYQRQLGIDHLICPEYATAVAIARTLRNPGSLAVENFARDKIEMQELKVSDNAKALGVALSALDLPRGVRIATVTRGDRSFIPDAATAIIKGDIVTLVGEKSSFDTARKLLQTEKIKKKHVVVLGESSMGVWLCRALRQRHFAVRLYAFGRERAEEIAAKLPHVTVIQADPTEPTFFAQERIGDADAFVALSDDVLSFSRGRSATAVARRLSRRRRATPPYRRTALLTLFSP